MWNKGEWSHVYVKEIVISSVLLILVQLPPMIQQSGYSPPLMFLLLYSEMMPYFLYAEKDFSAVDNYPILWKKFFFVWRMLFGRKANERSYIQDKSDP